MKILSKKIFIYIALIFVCLSGCTNTPSDGKRTTSSTKAIELNADEQNSYQDALEAIKSDNPEKAIQPLAKITHNHSEHLGAWINLANAYIKVARIEDAEKSVSQAKGINPKITEIHNLQGLIYVHKGDYANAEKSYLQAIQLKEAYPAAHYNLGLLYDMYYQDMDRAVIQYDRYLELSNGADKKTIGWVTELKQKIKRRNK
jgi:Tfp pilus assembly protein PilF